MTHEFFVAVLKRAREHVIFLDTALNSNVTSIRELATVDLLRLEYDTGISSQQFIQQIDEVLQRLEKGQEQKGRVITFHIMPRLSPLFTVAEPKPCPCSKCKGAGVVKVGKCTCGGIDIGVGTMHEPGCGEEQCECQQRESKHG